MLCNFQPVHYYYYYYFSCNKNWFDVDGDNDAKNKNVFFYCYYLLIDETWAPNERKKICTTLIKACVVVVAVHL